MKPEEQEMMRPDFDTLLREEREYQSAYDKKVSQALSTARANWERERQAEQAQQSARLEAELERRLGEERNALALQRSAFEQRMRQVAVADALQKQGLDARFAPWITGADEQECSERVESFTALFRSALSQAVSGRMRGESVPREPETQQALTRESLRGMSAGEINRCWEQVAAVLREHR